MNNISSFLEEAKRKGLVLDFYGEQCNDAIEALAKELGTKLPPSFIQFLKNYGGGGFVGEWISGIYGSQPTLTNE